MYSITTLPVSAGTQAPAVPAPTPTTISFVGLGVLKAGGADAEILMERLAHHLQGRRCASSYTMLRMHVF